MKLITNGPLRRWLYREAVRRRWTALPYAPFEVYLDPSNVCDLRCTFCPQSSWGERARGMMSDDLFARMLNEITALRPNRLNLFCYGEALLHKNIFTMVRAAVGRGLNVRIHTNAKSLDETKAVNLLEAGLSEIHFSFDTADRDLYNRTRVRSDFDLVLGNIRRFLQLRRERGFRRTKVYCQELIPFQRGVPEVNSPQYRALFDDPDVIFDARFLHNFAGGSSEKELAAFNGLKESECSQIYRRIVITHDGKMHACCLDAEGYHIVGDAAAGDTIVSAWNGAAMQRLRRLTNERKVADQGPCANCHILWQGAKRKPQGPFKRLAMNAAWALFGQRGGPVLGQDDPAPASGGQRSVPLTIGASKS